MFVVFVDSNEHVGKGLNGGISEKEKERLNEVAERIVRVWGCDGSVLALAQAFTPVARGGLNHLVDRLGLIDNPGEVATYATIDGLLQVLKGHDEDTVLLFIATQWSEGATESFYRVFPRFWNRACPLFGMPEIPKDPFGDFPEGKVIVIDYVNPFVSWLLVESKASTTAAI